MTTAELAKKLGIEKYDERPMRRCVLIHDLGFPVTVAHYQREQSISDAADERKSAEVLEWVGEFPIPTEPRVEYPPDVWRCTANVTFTKQENGAWKDTNGYEYPAEKIASMYDAWKNPQRSDIGNYSKRTVYWNGDI